MILMSSIRILRKLKFTDWILLEKIRKKLQKILIKESKNIKKYMNHYKDQKVSHTLKRLM